VEEEGEEWKVRDGTETVGRMDSMELRSPYSGVSRASPRRLIWGIFLGEY
jgi:hypothetical protein